MDWKSASTYYAQQLKDALDVRRHALALADLSSSTQAGVTQEQKNKLQAAGEPVEKLMRRLQQGEFRIAVVGMEKAGKSTFVNAWLGCDLLPAKQARCTFTTTQIYSVQHDNEQRLETIPKTETEYEAYKVSLQEQAQSADKKAAEEAKNDLEVMKEHDKSLREIIYEGKKTHDFTRLDEAKAKLSHYVADERYAHAMHEARVFTSKLAAVDGIVFYDVPGLDSGLAKHIEESKEMLADCDAIILIQSKLISLKPPEKDLIKFGEDGDPYLKLADKLFVFWGQIDCQPSKKVLDDEWQQLIAEWGKFSIPEKRMVRGSAGAHLVLSGIEVEKVGTLEDTRQKMQRLTEVEAEEDLIQVTGIVELQKHIQHYLDEERTGLLEKRCNAMFRDIVDTAQDIYATVRKKYPADPEQAKREQEEQRIIEFSEWWGGRWEKIRADVGNIFQEGTGTSVKVVDEFHQRYEELVKEEMNKLSSRQVENRQQIFDSVSIPAFDSSKANIVWREKLYPDVRKMLLLLSQNLALELQKQTAYFVAELESQLWGSQRVQSRLIKNNEMYASGIERSLHTLFLRFARPIAEVLIRGAVGSETRHEIRNRIGNDIEIIDNYYQGEEPALKRLGRYATHGADLLTNDSVRKNVLGPSVDIAKIIIGKNIFANIALHAVEMATSKESEPAENKANKSTSDTKSNVIEEVETDVRVLEYYLLSGIFEAAGFSAFCQQELENLRDSFIESEHFWRGVVETEWQNGNPELSKELPSNLQEFKFDTEVSDKLNQLKLSLTKWNDFIG